MRGRAAVGALSLLAVLVVAAGGAVLGRAEPASDPGLERFRAWLDREHPGYGCDAGPALFRNRTVEAAYPGRRFYYVLTYTRGIPPPFQKALSLVAAVDDSGRVEPFLPGQPRSYGRGLKPIASSKDARAAAAAVMIVASCDPGEGRWPYRPDRFKVKKSGKGWKCTYRYDANFASWVVFDKKGGVAEFGGSAPPVP